MHRIGWYRYVARLLAAGFLTVVLAALLGPLASPAWAWNETGHRIVAAIAYDRLTPKAREAVDALIWAHPDYQRYFVKGAPARAAARARAAFIAASYWPDQIRNDSRFYNETRSDARPSRPLPGFPEMASHPTWHYFDTPFSPDGTPLEEQDPPHALSELKRLIRIVGRPVGDAANPAYALPWIIHLVGDLHNPLHTVSRFTRDHPRGDQGGNLVQVQPGNNLHSFWDGAGGKERGSRSINRRAAKLYSEYREKENTGKSVDRPVDLDPETWVSEGFQLAREVVYNLGSASGSRGQPISLSVTYRNESGAVADARLVLAGVRLAAILNRELD